MTLITLISLIMLITPERIIGSAKRGGLCFEGN